METTTNQPDLAALAGQLGDTEAELHNDDGELCIELPLDSGISLMLEATDDGRVRGLIRQCSASREVDTFHLVFTVLPDYARGVVRGFMEEFAKAQERLSEAVSW